MPNAEQKWKKRLSQVWAKFQPALAKGIEKSRQLTRWIIEKSRPTVARVVERSRPALKRMSQNWKKSKWPEKLEGWKAQALEELSHKSFQNRGAAFYGKIVTLVMCTYFLGDVAAILAGKFIPEPPPHRGTQLGRGIRRARGLEDYEAIFSRNLFNRKGIIPGEEQNLGGQDLGGAPIRTTLPFNLIGTLILRDELRSIATIEDKSASLVYPVRIQDEIPSKARILKIESNRVIFINTSSGRREFIDLPEETLGSGSQVSLGTRGSKPSGGPGIEQVAPTQFNVDRAEVDKALSDLNNILTQARAVPNFENGVAAGYKLFQIVPGSIYDKLGLKNNDTIAGLNGSAINDPGQAFQMLSELKTAKHLELQIKRDGKTATFAYDIH